MTPDEEADRIRALLREAHRDDEPCPSFQRLVRHPEARQQVPRAPWAFWAAALAAVAAGASFVTLLSLRDGRAPPTPPAAVTLASAARAWEGPLDFLLELPRPPPLDALPSLRAPLQTKAR